MDVAGTVACGLGQERIEHADDGRVVRGFQQVFNGGQGLHHARQVHIGLHLADDGGGAGFTLGISSADALAQQLGRLGLDLGCAKLAHDFSHGTLCGVTSQVVQP